MRRINTLGAVLAAIFALSAIAAIANAAEPTKILPEPTRAAPLSGTSKGGRGTLTTVGGNEVKCVKAKNTFEFTSPNEGTTHVTFEECRDRVPIIGGEQVCTGRSDREGQILYLGTVLYLLALLSERLIAALIALVAEFEFICGSGLTEGKVKVKGCVSSLAEPIERLTNLTRDVFREKTSGSGTQDIQSFLPVEGRKEEPCQTLTKVNSGSFEESGATGTAENEKFEQSRREVSVLLMN
jgi:hypothetical protein